MKKFYLTPGPSQLYYTVEEHIKTAIKEDVASISHRSKAFQDIYGLAVENLRMLLKLNEDHHVFFTSSANEIWERIIQNLVEHESYHLVNGAFSKRFQKVSEQLGRNSLCSEVSEGEVVDVEKILIPETAELISFTQNETSTGASQPVEDIYKIRKAFPNQLIALDVVSSVPYLNIDFSKVDTAYFSVQKCFGLPSGLGVWIVNNRCIDKCHSIMNKGLSVGSYHSLPELIAKGAKNQTPETPNTLNLFLLGKVAKDMLTKGVDQIRRETEYKAAVLYNAFEESKVLTPFVKDKKYRSKTTLVAQCKVPSSEIIQKLAQSGLILGSGYGVFKNDHVRIANFPTHSKELVEEVADQLMAIKI